MDIIVQQTEAKIFLLTAGHCVNYRDGKWREALKYWKNKQFRRT